MSHDTDLVDADLSELVETITRLSEYDLVANADADQLVWLLSVLRAQRTRLAQVEAVVEAAAAKALPYGTSEVNGFAVEVRGGRKRTEWDRALIAGRLARYLAIDEQGEFRVDPATAEEIVGQTLNAASVSGFKVTVLRAWGVEFDDACRTEPGRRTVQITSGEAA